MVIYSGFSHEKWWFSIVMLVYQRVYIGLPRTFSISHRRHWIFQVGPCHGQRDPTCRGGQGPTKWHRCFDMIKTHQFPTDRREKCPPGAILHMSAVICCSISFRCLFCKHEFQVSWVSCHVNVSMIPPKHEQTCEILPHRLGYLHLLHGRHLVPAVAGNDGRLNHQRNEGCGPSAACREAAQGWIYLKIDMEPHVPKWIWRRWLFSWAKHKKYRKRKFWAFHVGFLVCVRASMTIHLESDGPRGNLPATERYIWS